MQTTAILFNLCICILYRDDLWIEMCIRK